MPALNTDLGALPITPGQFFGESNTSLSTEHTYKLGRRYRHSRKNSAGETEERILRLVKNGSGGSLTSEIVTFGTTTGWPGKIVDAQCNALAGDGFAVADEYYGVAIPANEYFYLVEDGPGFFTTPDAATSVNVISINDRVVCGTTGRAHARDTTGATTPLASQIENVLGRALSAATTANTATRRKMNVCKAWPS